MSSYRMINISSFTSIAMAVSLLCAMACNKHAIVEEPRFEEEMTGTEVSFLPRGVMSESDVETKTSVVTSLDASGFYASAVKGSAGSDVQAWTNVSFTKVGDDFKGGKYWPLSNPSYRFYASNMPLTYTSGGATISANNSTDVVCAYKSSPTYGARNTLNFEHIYARVGTVNVTSVSPYNVSNITIWLVNVKTGGTYNLYSGAGATDATGWSSLTPASATDSQIYYRSSAISSGSSAGTSNDLYVVPGTYQLKCTWTASVGDYSQTYTTKTSTTNVTLQRGKVNNINCQLSGDASPITVSVSLTAWGTENIAATLQDPPLPSFGGLNIAPAPLYYNGTTFVIKDDDWNHDSYFSIQGKNEGSYYFDFIELGSYFDSRGDDFSTSSGDIDNLGNKITYGGYTDWRIPTRAEWCTLTTGTSPGVSRPGSTFNGSSGVKFALIKLTGVTHAATTEPFGVLLFPDGETVSGKSLTSYNSSTCTSGITAEQLQNFLNQGCVFVPCSNAYESSSWSIGSGCVWTSTHGSSGYSWAVYISQSSLPNPTIKYTSSKYPVRLVRDVD